ncbi:hypothetical protein [Microbacterium rhizomatis]|uniref:Alpha-galactosidase n=1 Tax=Microbacterium rhizomatis TaxID=1631477 RepID=A0A5J5J1H7_9MICO|nr:hypothetical protein [Microbacterium rhizomatis]KAA9108442.1 hypothetical protein F6B43_13810 [Microbacterium rhizomatis]
MNGALEARSGARHAVQIRTSHESVTVSGPAFAWEWSSATDLFRIRDARGRVVVEAPLQPAILLAETPPVRGRCVGFSFSEDRLEVAYDGVNGADRLRLCVRFDEASIWFPAPEYTSGGRGDEVVSVMAFADWSTGCPEPGMVSDYLVHPGASESSVLGPVIPAHLGLDLTTWLGRGSNDCDDIVAAQWGLPVHYFAGFSIEGSMCERGALTERLSASFCLGLSAIPPGDLLLRQKRGRTSPLLRVHSDLWHHMTTGAQSIELGTAWVLTIAPTYDAAVRGYYRALRRSGIVTPRSRSPRQQETLSRPQFNTWGAQCAAGTAVEHFTQDALESIYADVGSSGMRPGVFVIDDKWEGEYGLLEHDPDRFPRFDEFLQRVRADGVEVGLWAAFLRCDDPASHGLGPEHMLCDPSGKPVLRGNQGHTYYLFDVSQDEVRARLTDLAQRFMRRYRPNVVKFDFGYELPALVNAAPRNRAWGGELLLVKALELVIGAMRAVDPDVVVMYYNLSPLLADHIDLHSTDDMYLNADEYHLEANRRLFFSSLLGEVGVPSYGSGGYDWLQMADIWLDTVAFGPIGSLGSFHGDPRDSSASDLDIARYNGLAALTRRPTTFSVEPLAPAYLGGSSGARSASWARYEGDRLTALVLRSTRFDGARVERSQDLVRTTVPTAIVSRTAEGLHHTTSLGMVCLGPTVVTLTRPDAEAVSAIAHASDGSATTVPVDHEQGAFSLRVDERMPGGAPIEWIELAIVLGQNASGPDVQ